MDKEKLNNLFEEIKKSPEKRNELLLNFLKEELDYEPEGEKKEFKEWDTAFINDLPDIAFAYVEKGEKDEEGKTVPRTNRHLPHHGMNVKSATENDSVDLPHLRNALARLPQTNLSEEAKAKAKAHLEAHARALGVGEREEKSEAPEEPSKDKEELSQSVVSEYKKLLELNEEIINKLEEVSKETLVREKQIQDYEKSISDLRTRLSVFEAERKEKKARAFARKVEQTAKLYCELLGSEGEDALNSAKEMFSKFSEEKLESECARLESRKIAKMSAEPDVVTKSSVEKREVPKPVAKFQEVDTSKMDKKEKTDYLYKKLVNLYGG